MSPKPGLANTSTMYFLSKELMLLPLLLLQCNNYKDDKYYVSFSYVPSTGLSTSHERVI